MKKYKLLIVSIAIIIVSTVGYLLLFNDDSLEVATMESYKTSITKMIEVSGTINSSNVEVINLDPGKTVLKTYVKENDVVEKNSY